MKVQTPSLAAAVAYEDAGPYAVPSGGKEDGFYSRLNASLSRRFERKERLFLLDLFYSRGRDIGKPSMAREPTVYPEDVLAFVGLSAADMRSGISS